MGHDVLGPRMKDNYENRTRNLLPRRTYTVIRLDGKAFHTFTRHFERPFDYDLMAMMDQTSIELAKSIQGVKFCFTQSDEVSLIMTDFETEQTDAWFDGNIQKIASVSASIATAAFNKAHLAYWLAKYKDDADKGLMAKTYAEGQMVKQAHFDSRVFTIPDRSEVFNYLIWRQQDATRNSIQMGAQALYSHGQLHGKNTSELQELMFQKGVNWNDYPSSAKRGRAIIKESYLQPAQVPTRLLQTYSSEPVWRTRWTALTGIEGKPETPIFTQDIDFLKGIIPTLTNE